ncbi:extensin family protein [Muricoccus radiodurans]|uniref:extensin-like domain-containing protein n=1 Tax=Muricoccus radiodurans TaxID=2231721 RepID=UPI003CEDDBD7
MRRWLLLLVLPVLVASVLWVLRAIVLPPAWNPSAPLDLRDAPNWMTRVKLGGLDRDPEACIAALIRAGLPVQRLPPQPERNGCGIRNPVRLAGEVSFTPFAPVVNCPVAAAWAIFERHGLQPAATAAFGQRVVSVRHLGAYNCRNVNGPGRGVRSEHATANALDIAAFTLADGRSVGLPRDWRANGPAGAFLTAVRDGACRVFAATLGPAYNAAHRDHFHLDRGGARVCQ